MSVKKIALWIAGLVVLDFLIKVIIYHYFYNTRFEIIPGLLAFNPQFNEKYSYVNELLYKDTGNDLGLLPHLFYFVVMECIVLWIYRYFKSRGKGTGFLDWGFVFFQGGYLSAFFYLFSSRGCLDYLDLKPFFVFDLKDIYITCFVCLFLLHSFYLLFRKPKGN